MHTNPQSPRLSVSTWSLHRTLGDPAFYGVDQTIPSATHNRGASTLLELPARVASAGIHTLEICHFHLPTLDPGYLAELRAELRRAEVELFSLLVDDGDLTHPQYAARDLAWLEQWLPVASSLGARCTRVIAGKALPTPETLDQSYSALTHLSTQARSHGVRLMTENWFNLLSTPETVLTMLDRLDGNLGLCLDFGNWHAPEKYAGFVQIASRAESCHTKASFTSPYILDEQDYRQCLDITHAASFSGPYTLIYDGPDADEWQGLQREVSFVIPYLS